MESLECSKTKNCPIFSGILKGTEFTETYKKLYCLNGKEGRQKCTRYQVSQIMGKCPPDVLPNSNKKVEEIIAGMKSTGMTV